MAHKTEMMAVRLPVINDSGDTVEFDRELQDSMNPWIPFAVFEDTMWLYRHVYVAPEEDRG